MTTPDVRLPPVLAVQLVAGREVRTRLRSKAFRISTAVTLVLLIGFAIVMKFVGGGVDATVGLTGPATALQQPLQASAKAVGVSIDTKTVPDESAGRDQVAGGDLDALLVGDGGTIHVVVKKQLDEKLRNALNVLASQLALNQEITRLGGNPGEVGARVADAQVQVTSLEPPYPYQPQQLALGIIAGILIYMALLINGQSVAQGVVEEKSSRVVELLLATIRPWELMAGKVLGIGLVGLIQMVVIGTVGVIAGLSIGVLTISVSAAFGTVLWLIVWFLLGFVMYSLVFAALAALVSRQEDVGGVISPVLMVVVLGYVLGISILPSDPGNRLCEVLSIIPFFAPTMMPMRAGDGRGAGLGGDAGRAAGAAVDPGAGVARRPDLPQRGGPHRGAGQAQRRAAAGVKANYRQPRRLTPVQHRQANTVREWVESRRGQSCEALVIKVMLADDEELVRSGLRTILSSAGDIEVVAECDDGVHVADLARQHRPAVVLLDIRMRTADGLSALRRLRALPEPPAVAMLTTFDVDEYVQEALRIGANGFLLKDTEPVQLIKAVRDLARGGAVLDPKVAARVLSAMADGARAAEPARRLLASLSEREREVVTLIGQGLSNAEIGNELHLSEATVKGYVSAVLGKIGAVNRVQAALVAYRGGLIA